MPSVLEWVALVVALVALCVSSLQAVLEYFWTAHERVKVNSAAIGKWSDKNKTSWSWREFKYRIQYARPSFMVDEAISQLKKQTILELSIRSRLATYDVRDRVRIGRGPYGLQVVEPVNIELYTQGEDQRLVPFSDLSRRERRTAKLLQDHTVAEYITSVPCKATWSNMMSDIGLDISSYPSTDFLDAAAIVSTLDAPTMQIRISDLICAGFLLGMEVSPSGVDMANGISCPSMIGKWCNIISRHQEGVGIVARYSGHAHKVLPLSRLADPIELDTLLDTARGSLCVGDLRSPFRYLGFNSVDMIFAHTLEKCQGEDWQKSVVDEETKQRAEEDSHIQWGGKWKDPKTPCVAFLLAVCSNIAIAHAFPHRYLNSWTREQRQASSQAAFRFLASRTNFIIAEPTILKAILESEKDIIFHDDYKVANGYGCESGGLRGWLSTNLSEFTSRMSAAWTFVGLTEKVPLLPQLELFLRDGSLDNTWSESYNLKKDMNVSARTLLWLQVMMLDTWIARHVEILMGGDGMAEVAVPADANIAQGCATQARKRYPSLASWKPSRMRFTRTYLMYLAEGVEGKGVSFMSLGERHDPASAWNDIPLVHGRSNDWAVLDAVLTLRAVIMAVQLYVMKDSSVLLDLMQFDPMTLLA